MHNISNFRGQFIPLKNMPFFLPGIDFVIKVSLSLSQELVVQENGIEQARIDIFLLFSKYWSSRGLSWSSICYLQWTIADGWSG